MWCVADNGYVQPQGVAVYSDPAGQTWIGIVLSIQVGLNFTVALVVLYGLNVDMMILNTARISMRRTVCKCKDSVCVGRWRFH